MSSATQQPIVLFVDDDLAANRNLISRIKRRNINFECISASSSTEAIALVKKHKPEVAIIDLSLDETIGPKSGLRLITELQESDPTTRLLVLTGHGAEEYGIKALHCGASSFLNKPAQVDHLLALINDAIVYAKLKRNYHRLSSTSKTLPALSAIQSRSKAMKPVIEAVAYAASVNQPILLIGETGTGKGVIAQTIHKASSRNRAPFIRYQPTFGNLDLTSSELFGHQKGAFTGALTERIGLIEEASNGTLLIDEVDELTAEAQILLLNVLQEKIFRRIGSNREIRSNFRLITATNRSIDEILEHKKLRQDFYHRISHFTIEIPPLRERPEDINELALNFLRSLVNREKLAVNTLSEQAQHKLLRHTWPGNIRELQAVVESAVYRASFHNRTHVDETDITIKKRKGAGVSNISFRTRVAQFEKQIIHEALERCKNNQTKAAELLQLDRSTMRRIIARDEE